MKKTSIDILKAIFMTLAGVLIGYALVEGLKFLAKLANLDTIYIIAGMIFSIVVYANYQLIKSSK